MCREKCSFLRTTSINGIKMAVLLSRFFNCACRLGHADRALDFGLTDYNFPDFLPFQALSPFLQVAGTRNQCK